MSTWTDKVGRRHVGIMAGGKRVHRIVATGSTASNAKQLEAEIRTALGNSKTPQIPGDPKLTEIMTLYMAHADTLRSPDTAKHHALRIGQWLEKYRASQSRQAAAHIISDMTGYYAPATINRSLGTLKKALHLAWERNIVPIDYSAHVKRLPENNQRTTYLTIEQVQAIAQHASKNVQAAIWIALLTGARRGEICKLQTQDIGTDSITIQAGNTKTLRTRTVPIIPALRPWLSSIPLAVNFEGLKSGFVRAREAAGMPSVHFHDLRHSCASILINMGAPLEVVRAILGHTTVKTTERYAHLQISKQRDALEMLSAAVTLAEKVC